MSLVLRGVPGLWCYDPHLSPCVSTDPTKFFGCELGAQTQFDAKNDRFIVNGSHEANKLQDMLDGFIRKFVLCPECDNPETDLVSHHRGTAHTRATAGWRLRAHTSKP